MHIAIEIGRDVGCEISESELADLAERVREGVREEVLHRLGGDAIVRAAVLPGSGHRCHVTGVDAYEEDRIKSVLTDVVGAVWDAGLFWDAALFTAGSPAREGHAT